jgi:hypothetical protein
MPTDQVHVVKQSRADNDAIDERCVSGRKPTPFDLAQGRLFENRKAWGSLMENWFSKKVGQPARGTLRFFRRGQRGQWKESRV